VEEVQTGERQSNYLFAIIASLVDSVSCAINMPTITLREVGAEQGESRSGETGNAAIFVAAKA
jgi:hypothetical protein